MQSIWDFLTDFGDTAVTVPLALLMVGFLLAARQPRLAIGWGLAIVGCAGAISALKLALSVCGHPLSGSGLHSPSGHTAMSIAVYGGFAAVLGATLKRPAREAVIAAAAVPMIGIGLSRAILGVHSPLEVAIGVAVGAAAVGVILVLVARYRPARLPVGWLGAGALVVFLLFHGTRWPTERGIDYLSRWFDFLRPWCS